MILLLATVGLLTPTARAADAPSAPVDVGVIKDSDLRVVQKMIYRKTGRNEIGLGIGLMPFNAYLTTPNVQLGFTHHLSEALGVGGSLGGGYGLKNATLHELESATYGVEPDAYRYLASVAAYGQYAPIYAKMNINGARIVHFDVYTEGGVAASFEQSIIPNGGFAVSPSIRLGLGTRFYLSQKSALHVALTDDLVFEHRKLTNDEHFKQNADVVVSYTILTPAPGSR